MKIIIFIIFAVIFFVFQLEAFQKYPWSESYHDLLIQRFAQKIPTLVSYPSSIYPNSNSRIFFSFGKVLIFGYGSLMNKESILSKNQIGKPTVKNATADSMIPVVAFGVKRIYNYVEQGHWRSLHLHPKEKAMLNLLPSPDFSAAVNGILIEVDEEDLARLIFREEGYDLVPILVAPWEQLIKEKENVEFIVAYAFMAANELRNHTLYTSTDYYPIKRYMRGVEKGAADYGNLFLQMMHQTTYLADGTTRILEWNGNFDILLRN